MNTFVASGINAAPKVPQEMIIERTNHKLSGNPPNNVLLTQNVIIIDNIDVIHTKLVKGASKSNFLVILS